MGATDKTVAVGALIGGAIALFVFILVLCLWSICFPRKRQVRKVAGDDLEALESGREYLGDKTSGTLKASNDLTVTSDVVIRDGFDDVKAEPFPVDKSVEFSFEELAAATNNFDLANRIGEGGYGAVYLAALRGQQMAVKRMNLQSTREFTAELQVLTHVYHTNLVQLIGYCMVDSLFLVYEYVENGTLDRHLHGHRKLPPLSWPARVQIALDTARGLEYIHEGTKPTYVHRDVKSNNILIDWQLHAKVSDFGLTKLTHQSISRSGSISSLVGTFGYMAPEYAKYGDVSPKVDVYSFGVILFEIISAKEAIVRKSRFRSDPEADQRDLVPLFEEVLKNPDGKEQLRRLVDPALDGNYPLESVWKMAQLAGACTRENPELRPSMRTAVVALMTLSSPTQSDWEMSYMWNTDLRLSFDRS